MNYTLTQAIDRTKDLSGIIKAARAHEADCAADHEAKKNIAEIAGEAHSKAIAAVVALEQEREELADHVAALVRRTGEPMAAEEPKLVCRDSETGAIQSGYGEIVADAARFNSFFSTADTLADRLMANGEAKVNEALNRAQEGF